MHPAGLLARHQVRPAAAPGGVSLNMSRGMVATEMRPGTTAPSAQVVHTSGMTTPMERAMLTASRFCAAPVMKIAATLGDTCSGE